MARHLYKARSYINAYKPARLKSESSIGPIGRHPEITPTHRLIKDSAGKRRLEFPLLMIRKKIKKQINCVNDLRFLNKTYGIVMEPQNHLTNLAGFSRQIPRTDDAIGQRRSP